MGCKFYDFINFFVQVLGNVSLCILIEMIVRYDMRQLYLAAYSWISCLLVIVVSVYDLFLCIHEIIAPQSVCEYCYVCSMVCRVLTFVCRFFGCQMHQKVFGPDFLDESTVSSFIFCVIVVLVHLCVDVCILGNSLTVFTFDLMIWFILLIFSLYSLNPFWHIGRYIQCLFASTVTAFISPLKFVAFMSPTSLVI